MPELMHWISNTQLMAKEVFETNHDQTVVYSVCWLDN